MDKAAFVQKVKMLCLLKGIKPTNACKESGVGGSFLSDISSRGQSPSVERVQKLASYLGVTTSELLGEVVAPTPGKSPPSLSEDELLVALAYRAADERARSLVDLALEPWKKPDKLDEAM